MHVLLKICLVSSGLFEYCASWRLKHLFQETLVEFLEKAAEYMEKAQRFEVLGDIYKLVIPIYEKMRNFQVSAYFFFVIWHCTVI